ncbi:MAG: hypothetical protein FJ318_09220 [SAR202 cluster bacterium]|nr:hypothetical protein [SAR202 cluster bacterium]
MGASRSSTRSAIHGQIGMLATLLALVAALAACGAPEPAEPSDAQAIAQRVRAAARDVATYRTSLYTTVRNKAMGDPVAYTMSSVMESATDTARRRSGVSGTATFGVSYQSDPVGSATTSMYMIGYDVYAHTRFEPGPGDQPWIKSTMPASMNTQFDDLWAAESLEGRTRLLEDVTESSSFAVETIEGRDYYVPELQPNMRKILEAPGSGLSSHGAIDPNVLSAMTDLSWSVRVRYWIHPETFLPLRALFEADTEAGDDGSIAVLEIRMDTFYWDFDEPMDIALPPEALNAVVRPWADRGF